MRNRNIAIDAPEAFVRQCGKSDHEFTCNIELITPMAGGGTESWKPDLENPVRTQSIKGQLRFWWRTMQYFTTAAELRKREGEIWGSTDAASKVKIYVEVKSGPEVLEIERNSKGIPEFDKENIPAYVLFPLVSFKGDAKVIRPGLKFRMTLSCTGDDIQQQVKDSVRLWVLFGGLGARTRRGCGSLYCPEIMDKFTTCEDIKTFIKKISPDKAGKFGTSSWPVISNSRFVCTISENQKDPAIAWKNLLDSYVKFRQGWGVARNQGHGNRPGRTRWPEADAIRRITGKNAIDHTPEHPAGNWFPRGAYGLPILTKFKNAHGDPRGEFILQPAGYKRWPSPVFLKVIKLDDKRVARICLILNHAVPEDIVLTNVSPKYKLANSELPMSFAGKKMPENEPLRSGENPYDALIRHLTRTEVK